MVAVTYLSHSFQLDNSLKKAKVIRITVNAVLCKLLI